MIDLGGVALHGEGLTFFPDHADPGRFHYLPDRPRIRTSPDGSPEISLLKYRLDPTLHAALGAGLLSVTVDLSVDPEILGKARRRLARHAGVASNPALTPVAADSGSCELTLIDRTSADDRDATAAADAGHGLVERILGTATPSLYGSNATTFQAVLSPEGVGLVEGALRGGGLPVGIVYALNVPVLRPAIRADITARWRDVYHFYENRFHGGRLLVAADIGPTMEQLVRDELITISVDHLVPAAERNATYERALDQAQRYVLNTLFKPTLGQQPPADDGGDGPLETIGRTIKDIIGVFSFTYSLRQVDRDELKTYRYRLNAAEAEILTLAPQGTIQALSSRDDGHVPVDDLIVAVEPAASAEMRFDVAASLDLDAEGIDHVEVVLTYGSRDQRLMLDAATPRADATFWYDAATGPAVTCRYECQFRPGEEGISDRLSSQPEATTRRVIRINPRDLYRRVIVRAVTQGVPFDRYPRILLDLEATDPVAGWSSQETFELDANHQEVTFGLRAGLDAVVRLRRRLRYIDAQGGEVVRDWDAAEPGILVVGDPLPAVQDLLVLGSARFGSAVRRLIVELRPGAAPDQVVTRILTADEPSATWSWTTGDRDAGYEYRVTVQTSAGEVREGRWLPGTPGKLIVGEGGRLRPIELMLVGKTLEELDLLALKVRFAFEDPEAALSVEDERLVEDTRQPIAWAYPVADSARQGYTYQLTLVHRDGTVERRDPVVTSDQLVVVPLT
jgi:hypothetical protein